MIAEPLRLFMALSEAPEMKNKWGRQWWPAGSHRRRLSWLNWGLGPVLAFPERNRVMDGAYTCPSCASPCV